VFPAVIFLSFYVRDELIRAIEAGGKNNAAGRLNDPHISAMSRLVSRRTAVGRCFCASFPAGQIDI
jgi:hypothetical protein